MEKEGQKREGGGRERGRGRAVRERGEGGEEVVICSVVSTCVRRRYGI